MPLRDFILEAIPFTNWPQTIPVLGAMGATGIKVRKGMLLPWGDFLPILGPKPLVIVRSDSEIADEDEIERVIDYFGFLQGHARLMVELSNEPNHPDLHATPEQIAALIPGWLRIQERHPDIGFLSPPMMATAENAWAWHHPDFSRFKLAQHTYSTDWTPWHLEQLRPEFRGKPQWVTEFNTDSKARRAVRNLALLRWMTTLPYVQGVCLFAAPNGHPQFSDYAVDLQEAQAYGAWWKGQETMPTDQIRAWLVDMWRRQGANPNTNTDPFFAHALEVAKTQGRVIVPMLSKDGNYLNYSDPTRIVAYTIPPMWALKSGGPVQEGLPPNP